MPGSKQDTPIPENLLYTREQLEKGMKPGNRPTIPAWHLVDGVIKLTYWHAIKYYTKVLIAAEKARLECTHAQAADWVEGYHDFRNRRLEDVLKYLMDAYPPHIEGADRLHRQWEMVRNRTSECPQPPADESSGIENIKPYVIPSSDERLKRMWLEGVMEGNPEEFWAYLRDVKAEFAEGFEHLRELLSKGGRDAGRLERMSNTVKMMHNDISDFIAKYN